MKPSSVRLEADTLTLAVTLFQTPVTCDSTQLTIEQFVIILFPFNFLLVLFFFSYCC